MIVGIDLGTTNSLVSAVVDGVPRVLADEQGRRLTPSVVTLGASGAVLTGWEALEAASADAGRVAFSFKRLMGRGAADLGTEMALWPFDLTLSTPEQVRLTLGERAYSPVELSAFVLRRLKAIAEQALDQPVSRAVVTVPAYFDDAQRHATIAAAKLAGLEVARLVNEPTAACLAYGLDRRDAATVAVYDLGGGTFDCSVLRLAGGVFEVLATQGHTALGGDDIDAALMRVIAEQVSAHEDLLATPESRLALHALARQAKQALSAAETVELPLALSGGRTMALTIAREDLEHLARPLIAATRPIVERALADAGVAASALDAVVLVGGATRMPLVKELVGEWLGRAPDDALDPDEVVARGAALQADILSGRRGDMLLLDVVPLSLGIETMGGAVSRLIERNAPIPTAATERFTTFADNQTAVVLHVVQGERELAADCRSLARFEVPIPPQPAGLARVEVKFAVDANGLLTVTARDARGGETRRVEVQPSFGLSRAELERLLAESLASAEADAEAREAVAARNHAEAMVAATLKALADPAASALDEDAREEIERVAQQLRMAIAVGDPLFLREVSTKLDHATQHLAELVMNTAVSDAFNQAEG